jgi:hypothetical protein
VHWICESKSPRIAKTLLGKPLTLTRVDDNGLVGSHDLVDTANDAEAIPILELFVEQNWDVNQPNGCNRSNFLGAYIASMRTPVAVMKWLVEHGASLEMPAMDSNKTIIEALREIVARKSKLELNEVIELWVNRMRQMGRTT